MKIAIGSVNKSVDSLICEEGGRAPYYLIFDKAELVETWKNPMMTGGGGAGYAVVAALADKGVEKIIVGRIGPNMRQAITENEMECVEQSGLTVQKMIDNLNF